MPRALLLTTLVVSTLALLVSGWTARACIAANRHSASSKHAARSSTMQAASRG